MWKMRGGSVHHLCGQLQLSLDVMVYHCNLDRHMWPFAMGDVSTAIYQAKGHLEMRKLILCTLEQIYHWFGN